MGTRNSLTVAKAVLVALLAIGLVRAAAGEPTSAPAGARLHHAPRCGFGGLTLLGFAILGALRRRS